MRFDTVMDLDLLAGSPSLDFANTVCARGDAIPRDMLGTYADLLAWCRRAGTLPSAEMDQFLRRATRFPAIAARRLAEAKRLREAVHAAFSAHAAGDDIPLQAFDCIRRHVRRAASRRTLAPAPDGGVGWAWESVIGHLDRPHWPLALDAACLLTDPERLHRIRVCAGPHCGWLFHDTTKNGSRRWCSAQDCGNRAKVRAYRQRQRQEP